MGSSWTSNEPAILCTAHKLYQNATMGYHDPSFRSTSSAASTKVMNEINLETLMLLFMWTTSFLPTDSIVLIQYLVSCPYTFRCLVMKTYRASHLSPPGGSGEGKYLSFWSSELWKFGTQNKTCSYNRDEIWKANRSCVHKYFSKLKKTTIIFMP